MEENEGILINCPACNGIKTAHSRIKTEKIPYFGEVMEASIVCDVCGYKHSDVMALDQKDPVRYEIKISKDKLSNRVVRSQSATVSIPELGIKVEPGPKSQGYISNIEGVLNRFQNGVKQALTLFPENEAQKNAKIILEKLDKLLNGELKADLIIEDPLGQSNVVGLEVKKRSLSKEELDNLKNNFTIIDSTDQ
ncbi:MAG: ZPR1 zinc finger domain-containing protein [Methanobrevibacter sp.]|nr:ZPR1 zinc finger domain-containing protein [Candidatus Methanovirga aequatorialis]